jgi:hypothetical protein
MRKRTVGFGLIACVSVLTGCFGLLKNAQGDGVRLANGLHKQMADDDLAGIYNNADENYRNSVTRERSDALFTAIARKLGQPLDCRPGQINVNVNNLGTTLHSECETHFSKNATGHESFIWLKSGDKYKLVSYRISSRELVER